MGRTGGGVPPGDYRKVVFAASIGSFIEIYDLLVYGYFAIVLAEQFFPHGDSTAALLNTFAILAVGYFVNPIGAIIFGHIGDRIGRRPALAYSLLVMSLATLAFGLLPTYQDIGLLAPALLLLCRVLQGLSASGELPGATVFILEHAPSHWRGRAVAINNAAGNLGAAAAAAVGLTLAATLSPEQLSAWGWRVPFLIAAPIGFVGLYLRTRVLESPAFIALGDLPRQGRIPLAQALRTAKGSMLVLTVWTAAVNLGNFILVAFVPTYLIRTAELSAAEAFAASLIAIITLASSTLLGGYLADRLPVRRVAIAAMAGVAATAVPGFLIITEYRTFTAALIGQSLWAIVLGVSYTVGTMLSLALFTASVRFTATALASNIGVTLFGSTAPYVSIWLIATTGSAIAPGFYLLIAAIGGLLAVIGALPRRPIAAEQ